MLLIERLNYGAGTAMLTLLHMPYVGICEDGARQPVTWNRSYNQTTGLFEPLLVPFRGEIVKVAEGKYDYASSPVDGARFGGTGVPAFEAVDFEELVLAKNP